MYLIGGVITSSNPNLQLLIFKFFKNCTSDLNFGSITFNIIHFWYLYSKADGQPYEYKILSKA